MTDVAPGDDVPSPRLLAAECANGHLTIPAHAVCPECGRPQESTVDLTDERGTVVTWTTSTATPPGVRQPNHIAVVEFAVGDRTVRTVGQVTTDAVSIGTTVEARYVAELRDPDAGIRYPDSQRWDGFRFEPVD